jgi:hypothetical protein
MTCREYANRELELEDFLNGESAHAGQIEMHLAACAFCRQAVNDRRAMQRLLRETLEPMDKASPYFWMRFGARLREAADAERRAGEFWGALEALSRRVAFAAGAVLLVLAVGLAGVQFVQGDLDRSAQSEIRELVQRPAPPPQDHEGVLLSLASSNGSGGR